MNPTFQVETDSMDGMHVVLSITGVSAAGAEAELGDTDLALLRSAVRGQLDQVGHEDGRAVTLIDLTEGVPTILSCRTTGGDASP
jgi:hypothetical protein